MPIIYSNVTIEPEVEPITLDEAKIALKVDGTIEDSLISSFITAARQTVENHTNRSLITQTRVIKLDNFPCFDTIKPTYGKVQSVTSIKYDNDQTGSEETLSTDDYWTDFDSNIARIIIKNSWPGTYDKPNAVRITYVAGYGSSGASVPSPLIDAMYMILTHLYDNRSNVIVSGTAIGAIEIPFGASVLMSPYVLEQSVVY